MSNACPSCGATGKPGQSKCPFCGAAMTEEMIGFSETIPPVPEPAKPAGARIETMPCPFCAEPIPRGSTRCRWCNEPVGGRPSQPAGSPGAFASNPYGSPGGYAPPPPPPPAPPSGASVLVVGLLSFFCCGLLGPVAWIMGSNYEGRCRAMGMPPDGAGTAGKILGIVVTVLLVLGVFAWAAMFVLAMAGGAMSTP